MNTLPKCWAVIPAAGIGERVGASIPKQYLNIANKTILEHSIFPFIENSRVAGITIALNSQDKHFATLDSISASRKIQTVQGGATRAHSVLNALDGLRDQISEDDFVLVHDAARPCLSMADLDKLIDACLGHEVGGILAGRVADTIKQVDSGEIVNTLNRENIWHAYTPQMFKLGMLKTAIQQALNNNIEITDEASAIEYIGCQPCVVEGNARNIKVTTAEDVSLAKMFMSAENNL